MRRSPSVVRAITLTAGLATGLASAGLARADFFHLQTEGAFAVLEETEKYAVFFVETETTSQVGTFGFTGINAVATQTFLGGNPDDLEGVGVLLGDSDKDFIEIEFAGDLFTEYLGYSSFAGLWHVTDAHGEYEGLFGSGDFSGSSFFTDVGVGYITVTIQGNLDIPAPACAALLGLAVMARRSRRRRPAATSV